NPGPREDIANLVEHLLRDDQLHRAGLDQSKAGRGRASWADGGLEEGHAVEHGQWPGGVAHELDFRSWFTCHASWRASLNRVVSSSSAIPLAANPSLAG